VLPGSLSFELVEFRDPFVPALHDTNMDKDLKQKSKNLLSGRNLIYAYKARIFRENNSFAGRIRRQH